jgi:tripartite-type tricarboxylate transporter receptor subunit TctC
MHILHRRYRSCLAAAVLATAVASPIAEAQAENLYPLRLVVRCAAGSAADLLARDIARRMNDDWDQQVRVENVWPSSGKFDAHGNWIADGRTIVLDCGAVAQAKR